MCEWREREPLHDERLAFCRCEKPPGAAARCVTAGFPPGFGLKQSNVVKRDTQDASVRSAAAEDSVSYVILGT